MCQTPDTSKSSAQCTMPPAHECPELHKQKPHNIYAVTVTICSAVTLTFTEEMRYVAHDLGLIYNIINI